MSRLSDYIKETKAEMIHVTWPTRKQAVAFTIIVVAISLITAAYLGAFDYIFQILLQKFIL
ncbi:preprotein translocase subunit SecE [Patescibacteria group bacterium]|nr:preprotein translocase subunit SecE [Patescibacteria group bacterium]